MLLLVSWCRGTYIYVVHFGAIHHVVPSEFFQQLFRLLWLVKSSDHFLDESHDPESMGPKLLAVPELFLGQSFEGHEYVLHVRVGFEQAANKITHLIPGENKVCHKIDFFIFTLKCPVLPLSNMPNFVF
ncbi:hypothetical protein AVEN_47423-1 [Araneus ventricosus]|uniref:Uncharacterized protein n=1 Tax=Araneus ventricosus TaxID=182803 RepID=A0A4Y2KQJ0_ARAVE|nr:hypothetical protein AVEN_47423-1 [Araneus ventricosus]